MKNLKKITFAIIIFLVICSFSTNVEAADFVAGLSKTLYSLVKEAKRIAPNIEKEERNIVQSSKPDFFYGFENVSNQRKNVVQFALNMQGKVSYKFGAKPNKEKEIWTIGNSLDCSGFSEYVYHETTGIIIGEGTWNQTEELVEGATFISKEELQPGDLGYIYMGREAAKLNKTNHVGIFVGYDDNGNMLWAHCNALDNTVSVNSVDYWNVFIRILQ